jgi:hypothetical protein
VNSHSTVIIPFDDRVIFVGSLNRAEFSSRLSEVAQTFDTISGSQLLAGGRGLGERWPLARSVSGIAPGCDSGGWGVLRSLGIGLLVIWAIVFSFPRSHEPHPGLRLFSFDDVGLDRRR